MINEKSCENCQDYIVCYAYNKLKEEPCDDWKLDFMELQKQNETKGDEKEKC